MHSSSPCPWSYWTWRNGHPNKVSCTTRPMELSLYHTDSPMEQDHCQWLPDDLERLSTSYRIRHSRFPLHYTKSEVCWYRPHSTPKRETQSFERRASYRTSMDPSATETEWRVNYGTVSYDLHLTNATQRCQQLQIMATSHNYIWSCWYFRADNTIWQVKWKVEGQCW